MFAREVGRVCVCVCVCDEARLSMAALPNAWPAAPATATACARAAARVAARSAHVSFLRPPRNARQTSARKSALALHPFVSFCPPSMA